MRRPSPLDATLLMGVGAVAAWALLRQRSRVGAGVPAPAPAVRNAGPEEMTMPPRSWDIVDEQVDESFPASDPPGGY